MENQRYKEVHKFLESFGVEVELYPTIPSRDKQIRLIKMLIEEVYELAQALGLTDFLNNHVQENFIKKHITVPKKKGEIKIEEVADALIDIDVVRLNGIAFFGLGIDEFELFKEVMRANNTKKVTEAQIEKAVRYYKEEKGVDITVKADPYSDKFVLLYPDGKIAKSPMFEQPDLKSIISKYDG